MPRGRRITGTEEIVVTRKNIYPGLEYVYHDSVRNVDRRATVCLIDWDPFYVRGDPSTKRYKGQAHLESNVEKVGRISDGIRVGQVLTIYVGPNVPKTEDPFAVLLKEWKELDEEEDDPFGLLLKLDKAMTKKPTSNGIGDKLKKRKKRNK